jgi:hypothetical protein
MPQSSPHASVRPVLALPPTERSIKPFAFNTLAQSDLCEGCKPQTLYFQQLRAHSLTPFPTVSYGRGWGRGSHSHKRYDLSPSFQKRFPHYSPSQRQWGSELQLRQRRSLATWASAPEEPLILILASQLRTTEHGPRNTGHVLHPLPICRLRLHSPLRDTCIFAAAQRDSLKRFKP